jgi:hypothetical protein
MVCDGKLVKLFLLATAVDTLLLLGRYFWSPHRLKEWGDLSHNIPLLADFRQATLIRVAGLRARRSARSSRP